MKKIIKLFIALLCVFTLIPTISNVKARDVYSPTISETFSTATWDCIYFGNYYQTKSSTKKTPIKWRVLDINQDGEALVMADQVLAIRRFNAETEKVDDIYWANCTLRSWLNGYGASKNSNGVNYSTSNFIDAAFTSAQQNAIISTTYSSSAHGTSDDVNAGPDTTDKISLLSMNDLDNEYYGFGRDDGLKATRTAYLSGSGACSYWTRSGGDGQNYTVSVNADGSAKWVGLHNDSSIGVRPIMYIDLNKANYTYAGTVNDLINPTITVASSFTKTYGNSAFNLNVYTDANEGVTYKSSNTSVATVSSTGLVTIKGVGKATITVTSIEDELYKSISKKVTLTVKPKKTTLTSLTSGYGSVTAKWSKVSTKCSGYQVQISRYSSFSSSTKFYVNSYKTTSLKITGLTSKKKYYVRVRTYRTVNGTKYYSYWSGYKSVTVK